MEGSSTRHLATEIMADLGLPDDRPKVSELIKFFELLIKGQLEESLLLDLHSEAVRKIRNAVNDREGMSLLIRAFEENPTLLHKLREAAGNKKEQSSKYQTPRPTPKPRLRSLKVPSTQNSQSPPVLQSQSLMAQSALNSQPVPKPRKFNKQTEKQTTVPRGQSPPVEQHVSSALKDMLADLVDQIAGNAPVITPLNNHLFSSGLIPNAVYIDAQNSFLSPYDRANKMMNAVLATLKCHPNPNSVITSLLTALNKAGLTTIATKLMECFSKCMPASLNNFGIIFNRKEMWSRTNASSQ